MMCPMEGRHDPRHRTSHLDPMAGRHRGPGRRASARKEGVTLREEIVVIGAGPAGVAAAVQLRRYGHDPLLFERAEPGGLVRTAWRVDNYPGFPEGIDGPELAGRIAAALERWDVRLLREEVQLVDLAGERGPIVLTAGDHDVEAGVVVLATGTVPVPFSCPGLDDIPPERVHRDILRLRGLRGATVAIVGAGDAALDHAMALSEGNRVIVLDRSGLGRAIAALREAARGRGTVEIMGPAVVRECRWEGDRAILLTGGAYPAEFAADHIVIAVGRRPATDLLGPRLLACREGLEDKGLLYMVGDVARGHHRQTAIAAGDGLLAAMRVHERSIGGEG
ncbi:MAG TPA: NAD(P)/FAD-dependent oxidoreductase [Thermoplasmata archaeon]|nr:NAD(P)/FAD-dependent oxidoreductase [Thermoplasmata archaeon]